MKKIVWLLIVITFSIVIFFIPSKKTNITNEMCPVMTAEKVDANIYHDYQGQRVYLCCKRCLKKFSADPQKYMKNFVVKEHTLEESFFAKLISFIGKLHPIAVHFPIALFFTAIIAEILYILKRKENLIHVVNFCLVGAALSAIIAMVLGWCAYTSSQYKNELADMADYHKIMGILSTFFIVVVCAINYKRESLDTKSKLYIFLLIATALIIGVTGFLGTTLIFGLEHYNW